jgi:hypothetical protein
LAENYKPSCSISSVYSLASGENSADFDLLSDDSLRKSLPCDPEFKLNSSGTSEDAEAFSGGKTKQSRKEKAKLKRKQKYRRLGAQNKSHSDHSNGPKDKKSNGSFQTFSDSSLIGKKRERMSNDNNSFDSRELSGLHRDKSRIAEGLPIPIDTPK